MTERMKIVDICVRKGDECDGTPLKFLVVTNRKYGGYTTPGGKLDEATVGRFEVIFESPPTPGVLRHALSALSVACRLCGREAKALEAEGLAREYLSVRGWSS